MIWILDASVAVKWFIDEEHSSKALNVLEDILNDPTNYAVPELFFYELNHVLFRVLGSFNREQRYLNQLIRIVKSSLPSTNAADLISC